MIELLGLILSVGMFRRLAIRKHEQDQLLAESWRVNKDKIQHGYQNYQVGARIMMGGRRHERQ